MTQNQVRKIVNEAFAAAAEATKKMISENPDKWYPCGFAWVRIKPARGKFVNYLKSINVGKKDDFDGGYVIYNPSQNITQWMDAKYNGAKVFAEVLRKHGINASAECRMD